MEVPATGTNLPKEEVTQKPHFQSGEHQAAVYSWLRAKTDAGKEVMHISRDRAIFDHSRLYRQASEIADSLLRGGVYAHEPYAEAVACLTKRDETLVVKPSDLKRVLGVIREEIDQRLSVISPFHALPALFETLSELYSPAYSSQVSKPAISVPLKNVAVRVGRRVWTENPGSSASRLNLTRVLRLAFAETQLMAFQLAWTLQPDGELRIAPDGITCSPDTENLRAGLARTLGRAGMLQRFSGETTSSMVDDPSSFLGDVWRVLAGDPPSSRQSFQGTHLAELPGADQAHDYWVALGARLMLLDITRQVGERVHDNPGGIAILGPSAYLTFGPGLHGATKRDEEMMQKAFQSCYWKLPWLSSFEYGREQEAFVARPGCRIDGTRQIYVTSARNIADSLTWLSETAVGPYPHRRPVALPSRIFQELLSEPFEHRVIELFRAHGFIAGEVTARGGWRTQSGVFELPQNIERPKGQIDVLAWRADYMLTADCKVLQLPYDSKSLSSLWDKIRGEDSKYRQQVSRASRWSIKFLDAHGFRAERHEMALILDRPLHFWHQDDGVIVTDYELIEKELERYDMATRKPKGK